MRSLDLSSDRSWFPWGRPSTSFLRMILLFGLRNCARCISLRMDGDHTELCFHYDDRVEQLVPPPAHLVDELAEEVRGLASWRDRVTDWWERWRGCEVLVEREGTARLLLGGSGAALHYWLLPYSGGVFMELSLVPEAGAAERAA